MDGTKVNLYFEDESTNNLLAGVGKLARAVRSTMGPGGNNVLIEQEASRPILTKDGVTVAKSINLVDPLENLGAQLVKEAASGAADIAGDGTTTATVLTYKMFQHGIRMMNSGVDGVQLRESLQYWSEKLEEKLMDASTPVENNKQILQVGTLSANGEKEIGSFIVEAMETVGRDGIIAVEDAKGFKSYLEKVKGTRIDRGYISPYFVNDQSKNAAVLENPLVLLVSGRITNLNDLLSILEKVHQSGRPLLIVADDIEGEAMNALVVNNVKNILKCCAIRAPEFGNGRSSAMSDLAILLGTAVYSNSTTDITKVQVSDLGTAKKITVGRNETIIQDPDSNQKELEVRLDEIRTLASTPGLDINEKNLCQRRLSRLAGGIAIIRVGGSTEAELRERRDRIDDALHATKAAVNGGYLPGGGTALIKCLSKLKAPSSDPGYELLRKACEEPIKQIARNCGQVPELVSAKVLETKAFSHGYNARTDEYCDLIEAGVLDPTLVVTSALRHATSAAINLLSISCSITIEDNHD
jgi:chaperonin GroEL